MGNGKQLLESIRFVETKTILMSQIVFDENNPNVMSKEKHKAFDKVITKYGFAKDPWLNEQKDGTYLVIDGEQGIKRLQEHNVKKFQAKIFHVSYSEVRMLRQIANKLHGEHDKSLDALEFKAIFEDNKLDMFADFLAEPIEDFQIILEKNFDIIFDKEEEPIPEPPKKPKSKIGEVYQLGKHRVMCADCTDEKSIKQLLGDSKINLVTTDPPYGVKYEQGKFTGIKVKKRFEPIKNDEKQGNELREFIEYVFTLLEKFCDSTPIYVCSPSMIPSLAILQALMNVGFHMQSQIIWYKNQFILGRADYHWQHELIWYGYYGKNHYWCGDRTQSTVWSISKDPHSSYEHPTQKPVELFKRMIKNSSKKDQIIYDPFLGSGSTLIACEQTNRICYGMELDPGYIDVIIQRWQNYTNKKAVKL